MLQTLTFKVNVAPEGVPPVVRLSQNENGRALAFDMGGSGTVNIPSGSTVTLSGTKPDGNVYSATGTLSGTTATFDEDTQMTAVAGEWDAKLKVTYNGETIASVRIGFIVDADTVAAGAVPSSSELEGLVAEAQAYAESARDAVEEWAEEYQYEIFNDYATPEMYGAIGDGLADDTAALQNCFNQVSSKIIWLSKTYLISSSVTLTGRNVKIEGNGKIVYTGNDFAIKIHGMSASTISLNKISSENGGGIFFYSTSSNDYNQYIDLSIEEIYAKTKCVGMDKETGYGWTNEIRIHNTRFMGAAANTIGVYIKGPNTNGWSLINVGIEGVHTGLYMDGDGLDAAIINPRAAESFTYIVQTTGIANFILIDQHRWTRPELFNLSNQTRGTICGIVCDDGQSLITAFAIVFNGIINYVHHRNQPWYFYNPPSSVIDLSTINYGLVTDLNIDDSPAEFKLSPLFSTVANKIGINDFYIHNQSSSYGSAKIYDLSDQLIYNSNKIPPASKIHFRFDGETWGHSVEYAANYYIEVDSESLTLTGCGNGGYTHNGYKQKDNVVIVNMRVIPTSAAFTIAGFPEYQGNGATVGVSCSTGTGMLLRNGTLSVSGAQTNVDCYLHTVYITDK